MVARETLRGRLYEAAASLLAGVAALSGSFAAAGATDDFVAVAFSSAIVDTAPGSVVDLVLGTLGTLGKPLVLVSALAASAVFLGSLSSVGVLLTGVTRIRHTPGVITFALTAPVVLVLTEAVVPSLVSAASAAAVVVLFGYGRRPGPSGTKPDVDRRRALQASAGTVGLGAVSYLVGRGRSPGGEVEYLGVGDSPPAEVQEMLDEAEERSLELPDSPGLVSEYGEFYRVDINTVNPNVSKEDWSLSFTGEVDAVKNVDYAELRGLEPEHRFITLRCVGDSLNGRQMDNAVWTGVPLGPLVDEANPDGDHAVMRGEDGFFNTVPTDVLRDGFLAYGMNGHELPRPHGHPVRILLPGHWGEVNVKWVTEVEFVDDDVDGYWQRRGWDGTGRVNPVAKIWSTETRDDGTARVGGHAYAGLDGVSAVEVSTDGGETWEEASLSEPLDADDVWRQWTYEWDADDGVYDVVARTVDGRGRVQTGQRRGRIPDGATGWVSRTVRL